jgi:MoaA/NifB/PqqE/SkfB family radical SAM enzyme
MIATLNDIKWVHVEASSKCNAWCPACPRNLNGFGLSPHITEQDLLPARFEEIIVKLPNSHTIQLCGNYGDPIASAYITDLIEISKKYGKKIQIHTNGSLRNEDWWANFAQQLSSTDHEVWFGIDGLSGVHEIYRQGTDFNKIIKNAQAFIGHGGSAVWQFIPYQHNEHQIPECLMLSQQMNFKKFCLAHTYRGHKNARHYQTGAEFELLPASFMQAKVNRTKTVVEPNNCMHLSIPSIYVSASGNISRCCYLEKSEKFQDVIHIQEVKTDLTDQTCIKTCG